MVDVPDDGAPRCSADAAIPTPRSRHQPCPSIVVDLSEDAGRLERFLLAYEDEGQQLTKLALVMAGAVYIGGQERVEKPAAKKRLDRDAHLAKVRESLIAATAAHSDAAGESSAATLLAVAVTSTEAVLTVKEAVKGGSSLVVLATVRLPAVVETSGGLLLGAVRAAYQRGREAEKFRKDMTKASEEVARYAKLVDHAVEGKRKVLQKVLEKASLVINTKKAMIAHLQDQGSDNDASASDEPDSGDEDEAVAAVAAVAAGAAGAAGATGVAAAGGNDGAQDGRSARGGPPAVGRNEKGDDEPSAHIAVAKGRGEASRSDVSDAVRFTISASRDRVAQTEKRGVSGSSSGSVRRVGASLAAKVKEEPELDRRATASLTHAAGALAVPFGTQEVTGDELLAHVAKKGDNRGGGSGGGGSSGGGSSGGGSSGGYKRNGHESGGDATPAARTGPSRKRARPSAAPSLKALVNPDSDESAENIAAAGAADAAASRGSGRGWDGKSDFIAKTLDLLDSDSDDSGADGGRPSRVSFTRRRSKHAKKEVQAPATGAGDAGAAAAAAAAGTRTLAEDGIRHSGAAKGKNEVAPVLRKSTSARLWDEDDLE